MTCLQIRLQFFFLCSPGSRTSSKYDDNPANQYIRHANGLNWLLLHFKNANQAIVLRLREKVSNTFTPHFTSAIQHQDFCATHRSLSLKKPRNRSPIQSRDEHYLNYLFMCLCTVNLHYNPIHLSWFCMYFFLLPLIISRQQE